MPSQPRPLTFAVVDGIGFAAESGRIEAALKSGPFTPSILGPSLELLDFLPGNSLSTGDSATWMTPNGVASLLLALQNGSESWMSPGSGSSGFIRASRPGVDGNNRLVAFLMNAKRAAQEITGLPGTTPGQLAAAMQEMESNIHEHSAAADTGVIAYQATPKCFEFVVFDRGIGLLDSLRQCESYRSLSDCGKALEAALADGTSRFGPGSNHGNGFRPIFIGLANLRGELRFRSGDYALTMDGTSPNLTKAHLAQKPVISGFFASVTCYPSTQQQV